MKHILIYILVLICISVFGGCHKNREEILKVEVKGTIIEIYQDRKNHKVYTFNIKANSVYDRTFIANFYPKSWLYASIGDSIIKKKGESFITIIKKDGSSQRFETRVK